MNEDVQMTPKMVKALEELRGTNFPTCSRNNVKLQPPTSNNDNCNNNSNNKKNQNRGMCMGYYFQGKGGITKHTFDKSDLRYALTELSNEDLPDFKFTSIQVNASIQCAPHVDRNNLGPSQMLTLGDYTGGQTWVHDEENGTVEYVVESNISKKYKKGLKLRGVVHETRNRWIFFNAKQLHYTLPFEGERYTIVYFSNSQFFSCPEFIYKALMVFNIAKNSDNPHRENAIKDIADVRNPASSIEGICEHGDEGDSDAGMNDGGYDDDDVVIIDDDDDVEIMMMSSSSNLRPAEVARVTEEEQARMSPAAHTPVVLSPVNRDRVPSAGSATPARAPAAAAASNPPPPRSPPRPSPSLIVEENLEPEISQILLDQIFESAVREREAMEEDHKLALKGKNKEIENLRGREKDARVQIGLLKEDNARLRAEIEQLKAARIVPARSEIAHPGAGSSESRHDHHNDGFPPCKRARLVDASSKGTAGDENRRRQVSSQHEGLGNGEEERKNGRRLGEPDEDEPDLLPDED